MDLAVPHRTARDTARRTDGVLVTIERAGHSWLLRDPETLPAIVAELLATELAPEHPPVAARRRRAQEVPDAQPTSRRSATHRTPGCSHWRPGDARKVVVGRHRRPKYRWHTER